MRPATPCFRPGGLACSRDYAVVPRTEGELLTPGPRVGRLHDRDPICDEVPGFGGAGSPGRPPLSGLITSVLGSPRAMVGRYRRARESHRAARVFELRAQQTVAPV